MTMQKSWFATAHELVPLVRALRANRVSDFEFALLLLTHLHADERAERANHKHENNEDARRQLA